MYITIKSLKEYIILVELFYSAKMVLSYRLTLRDLEWMMLRGIAVGLYHT